MTETILKTLGLLSWSTSTGYMIHSPLRTRCFGMRNLGLACEIVGVALTHCDTMGSYPNASWKLGMFTSKLDAGSWELMHTPLKLFWKNIKHMILNIKINSKHAVYCKHTIKNKQKVSPIKIKFKKQRLQSQIVFKTKKQKKMSRLRSQSPRSHGLPCQM